LIRICPPFSLQAIDKKNASSPTSQQLWFKHKGRHGSWRHGVRFPLKMSNHTVTRLCQSDSSFFVQFLENIILDKNPDKSATIFFRPDARRLDPTCFLKASQKLLATEKGCCS
jgi:hypothetical protein